MEKTENLFRSIPQVETLLSGASAHIDELGRSAVVAVIREVIDAFRAGITDGGSPSTDGLVADIERRCRSKRREKLQRVINGTGVIIHTNLGRAPIAREILEKMSAELCGYCNLELYLPERRRGRRGGFAEELVCRLTGAEDALIVNNNASSVFLILNQFGAGREVIVSRGELIQIGGGFRIPDIMERTGARLVEVGTTNITDIEDYRRAMGPATAMIFSAHRSNFTLEGFASSPSLRELAALKGEGVLLVRDLGSGNLVRDERLGADFEPTVLSELVQGMDLVSFSGDKLLGACQAGIIVGRKDLVAALRKNPLMRMLRVDKITYFILQETLLRHANDGGASLALWDIIHQSRHDVERKTARLLRAVKASGKRDCIRRAALKSTYGGGSLPAREIESAGIRIVVPGQSADELYARFIDEDVPVVGYILDDCFTLDLRTVLAHDIPALAASIDRILPGGT
ncbi:MAG TPA: L-seryl-tRNA(Sec) selenium transferase [Spirochaetota bacterium]|nr:L-seryl-tRNA(Sec) selenium transferase [Spirochaetota bacterium]